MGNHGCADVKTAIDMRRGHIKANAKSLGPCAILNQEFWPFETP